MRSLSKEISAAQSSVRPDISVPIGSETPRLPRDYLIGPLGAGNGKSDAYREALRIATELSAGKSIRPFIAKNSSVDERELLDRLSALGQAPSVRVGSPAEEAEGGVSYLVRFLGRDASFSGELRLVRAKDGSWLIESLSVNADDANIVSSDFDPLSYKRFL
jgi:hypothetical protein